MKNFIELCNNNQGFLTAILSIATLFVSVIAIWISVRTARWPYKKSVAIQAAPLMIENEPHLQITIVNTGNVGLLLKTGCVLGKKTKVNMGDLKNLKKIDENGYRVLLNPNTAIVENVHLHDEQETIEKIFEKVSANNFITIYISDYSGWEYKVSRGFVVG